MPFFWFKQDARIVGGALALVDADGGGIRQAHGRFVETADLDEGPRRGTTAFLHSCSRAFENSLSSLNVFVSSWFSSSFDGISIFVFLTSFKQ